MAEPLGQVHSDLGERARALEYFDGALPLHRVVGNRRAEATTLNNIGAVQNALGDQVRALEYFDMALPQHRAVGNRRGEATTLNNIAAIYSRQGRTSEAITLMEQVVELREAISHPDLDSSRTKLAGLRAKLAAPPRSARPPYALFIALALALIATAGWLVYSR